jgi:hypothetical protein
MVRQGGWKFDDAAIFAVREADDNRIYVSMAKTAIPCVYFNMSKYEKGKPLTLSSVFRRAFSLQPLRPEYPHSGSRS